VLLGHAKKGGLFAVSVVNIGRALPSFAIIALVLPFSLEWGFGLGFWPTCVALVLLAVPPMFTNTYTGVRDVDAGTVEAAVGMGMAPHRVVWGVEMPTASPLIITGARVAAVQVVATATLGALVGFTGLGSLIIEGFAQQNDGKLLTVPGRRPVPPHRGALLRHPTRRHALGPGRSTPPLGPASRPPRRSRRPRRLSRASRPRPTYHSHTPTKETRNEEVPTGAVRPLGGAGAVHRSVQQR
jgi:hypothetical protein